MMRYLLIPLCLLMLPTTMGIFTAIAPTSAYAHENPADHAGMEPVFQRDPGPNAYPRPPHVAYMQQRLNNCRSSGGIVSVVVECVQTNLMVSMYAYVSSFVSVLWPVASALFVLAMMMTGFKIIAGIDELNKEVVLFFLKFGLVFWFFDSLGGFIFAPFGIVTELSSMAAAGITGGQITPWQYMDRLIQEFFGAGNVTDGNATQLYESVLGMVGASLFSGYLGILIFILAMASMITTLWFMFRGIYTYLASITLIAFIIVLSPLFIPLALFGRTTRYLYKWLDYLLAAMLHPVILFAFLSMFLGVVRGMLTWFINGFPEGRDFSSYWRNNQSLFSWVLNSDPQAVQQLETALGNETGRTAVQSFVSPSMLNAVNTNPMTTFSLDFGANQVWAMQWMVFGFLGLFITSYLMLSMINYLPRISEAIAGVVIGLEIKGIPFVNSIKQMWEKVKG